MSSTTQIGAARLPPESPSRRPDSRTTIVSLLLLLLALAVYNPAVRNGFVGYDDPAYVTHNPSLRAGLSWNTVRWAFRSTEAANWHPLTWLSHALDFQFFRLNPAGHHLTNVLLHAWIVVLLFLALNRLTGRFWRSAAVAGIFAVHPIQVESVAWVSERKNLLCTLFFLLALMAYKRYAQQPSLRRYLWVVLWFAMGLMSKPMVVTLPFVLLLLDYWPLQRSVSPGSGFSGRETGSVPRRPWRNLILEKAPLFLLSAASAVITLIAQKSGGAIRGEHPLSLRILNAAVSYGRYLTKVVWPSHLAVFYPYPDGAPPVWKLAISALALTAISVAAFRYRREFPYLIVGWLWFLGILVPMIGLVQAGEQSMADRYAYISFIGIFIAIIWAVADSFRARGVPVIAGAVLAAMVIASLSFATRRQISHWKDSFALWQHAISATEPNYFAEVSLGAALISENRLGEAVTHLETASRLNPRDAFSQLDLGVCEKRMGNISAAVEHYQKALQLSDTPSLRATAFSNLGGIFRLQRDYEQATKDYEAALREDPMNSYALIGLGLISQKTGDLPRAADYYSRGTAADPSDSHYLLLAQALGKLGRGGDAQVAFDQAERLSGNWAATQQSVVQLLQE